ncbi:antibiotic biosynthesis monooxygenase [Acuticoccus sediminis]|uniref:Antibiotic biosynthesis monooxygenase n=1 Tax=Acuticoccus sediminis TaxID=2184697 RepID=A0A8B2NS13_9HYPH|nr:putative quinol monooxygenase [Acuticoccus sediminis]RAI03018.1 antibiotic biosynthesis monooxygenase [Acuticoccus sediminis]
MVKVIAVLTAQEGHEEKLFEALKSVIEPTRAEPGCFHYDLYRDPKTPTRFVFDEAWESAEHLAAHARSAHLTAMREATKDILASREVFVLDRAS